MSSRTTVSAPFRKSGAAWKIAFLDFRPSGWITTPLGAAGLLLVIVVLSEAIAPLIDAHLPSAALAMVAYLALFFVTGGPDDGTTQLYRGAATLLAMLFVPVAVGVMTLGKLRIDIWTSVTLVVVGGTLSTLLVVGVIADRLFAKAERSRP